MDPISPLGSLDELLDLLRRSADLPELEVGVGQLDHGLQCTDLLRAEHPDDELAVAGLVHDLASSLGARPEDHGEEGALLVGRLLGTRVADLVRLHVPAKRYLVATDPVYRTTLSAGSIRTLERQGDAMDPSEITRFEAETELAGALALRRADDRAKDPGRPTSPLPGWTATLRALVER